MRNIICALLILLSIAACDSKPTNNLSADGTTPISKYFNYGNSGVATAGIQMIPIKTPVGEFKVWTKRFGNNPRVKVLLLHGGPAMTHEYLEAFESFFPQQGFEFYEYDQLGSYYSDQPTDSSLWTTERFVEEVEQVRQALHLTKDNFYLLGNSWGGILAMEYALKYQANLKGLIICNMMASCPDYQTYAESVLAKQLPTEVMSELKVIESKNDFSNPRYMELLLPNFYKQHLCRLEEWPDPVNRALKHVNSAVYTIMQGPSEFGIGGRLANWDIKDRLKEISVPTLTVGAKHDTMDPEHMKWMSSQVQNGRFLYCPNGSHFSMWDDQRVFMDGVIRFIHDTDANRAIKK
ncbi:MAG: proline iminopeptidase-family hydrolase [Chitinophagaceae bacterium]|nr:proline iminopeptidase-family hydrolase [Chitinophagaceae bacterium]